MNLLTVNETIFNVNIALKTVSNLGYFVYMDFVDIGV